MAPQELAERLPYHGCARHRKRTASFRCTQKKGSEAARADLGRSAHPALPRRAGILFCHLLVGGHRSGAWEGPLRKGVLLKAISSLRFPPFLLLRGT